jgi:hypothetical protein
MGHETTGFNPGNDPVELYFLNYYYFQLIRLKEED